MSCELAPNGLRNASLTIRDTQNGEKIGILRDLYSIGTDIFTNITFSNELQQLSLQDAELLVRWKNERGRFSIWGRDTSTENGDLDDTFATDPGAGLRKTLLYLLASTVSSLWSILLILDIKKTSKLHTFLQLLDTICSDVDDERWSARITVLADDLVDIQKQMDDIGIDDTDISDVLGDLLEDLKSTNDRLFGLIPAIEQHVKDSNATRIPPGAQAYISNIKDKFSSVSHVLATRLATINWQRHNRIRQQLETGAEEERVKQENKPEKDSALGTSLFTFELALPADVQNPYTKKYASSIVSATSFGTTTSGFSGNAKIPPPPVKLGSKTTFNCTICFKTVTMTENREWKKHVLRDLQPYSCTSDSCPEGDKTFDSRKDWIEHEFSCHRQETSRHWVCFDCGEMEFSDENSLAGHHSTNHRSLSDQATQYRFKPTSLPSKTCCPFCNETISQTKTDVKLHIGRHMDEIALKALPQSFGEIDEEGDDADSNIEDGTRQTLESHFSISMDSTTTIEHKQSHASDRCNPVDFEGVENQNTRESEDSILQPQLFPNDNLDSDASQSSQIPVSQFISKWAGTLAEYNDMQASRGLANGELEPLQSVEAALSGSRSPSPDVYASSLPLAYPFKSIIMDIPAPRHAIFAPNGMKRPPLLPPPRPPPPPPPPPVLHTTGVESAGFRGPSEPSQFLRMPPLGSGIRFESQRNENEIPARLCLRGGSAANEERMAESLEKAGCDMETESLEDSSVNPRNLEKPKYVSSVSVPADTEGDSDPSPEPSSVVEDVVPHNAAIDGTNMVIRNPPTMDGGTVTYRPQDEYLCSYEGCGRGSSNYGFSHPSHLLEHKRSVHGENHGASNAPSPVEAGNEESNTLKGWIEAIGFDDEYKELPSFDSTHTQNAADDPSSTIPSLTSATKPGGSQGKHACKHCGQTFSRVHNLKSHLLTHFKSKPFTCLSSGCNAKFRRQHDLKRHQRLHSGGRPFECAKCGRKFARGDALARHARGEAGCADRFGGEDRTGDEGTGAFEDMISGGDDDKSAEQIAAETALSGLELKEDNAI